MVTPLSNDCLSTLSDTVAKPAYDRGALSAGIVHIGVGNFHRAHQAIYLDRLFGMGLDHDWAVLGGGVRDDDALMRADLAKQDWLTTVVDLDPDGVKARICGPMIGFVEPKPEALVDALASADIRIVSLTVTEGGYYIDANTGGFAADHPEVAADIANPASPKTVFGIIVAALSRRRERGGKAFTVMSCDNLPGNGHVARDAVLGLASAISSDLAQWIEENASFPNSMVDCIAPATTERERKLVREKFEIADARPVTCEPFRQWVLEDNFAAGRPALEKVGVEFVADVAPYELMKLRILNGGHATIAYPAALLDIEMVHNAMADPDVLAFLRRIERSELIPSVPEISGVRFEEYYENVEQRFSNEAIADTIARLCQDGSNRQPKFILPIAAERAAAGLPIDGLALEVALWCRYCAGVSESGRQIVIDDAIASQVSEAAKRAKSDPLAFLDLEVVFGALGKDKAFEEAFSIALDSLWRHGVRASLKAYANGAA